jgi:hypothetical protein
MPISLLRASWVLEIVVAAVSEDPSPTNRGRRRARVGESAQLRKHERILNLKFQSA